MAALRLVQSPRMPRVQVSAKFQLWVNATPSRMALPDTPEAVSRRRV